MQDVFKEQKEGRGGEEKKKKTEYEKINKASLEVITVPVIEENS